VLEDNGAMNSRDKDQNRRERKVLGLDDFTEGDIAALEQSRAPESSKAFDHELKS
jgi:hypothetical protein